MATQATPKEIEKRIIAALRAVPDEFPNGGSNPQWTTAVKLALGKLGQELEFGVCGLRSHFDPGWLFDLCWYSTAEADGKLLALPLVLESEWGAKYEQIKFDFEKLLIAKSKFKVMVFQAEGKNITDYFSELWHGIRAFQMGSPGEVYLLACYDDAVAGNFLIRKIAIDNTGTPATPEEV